MIECQRCSSTITAHQILIRANPQYHEPSKVPFDVRRFNGLNEYRLEICAACRVSLTKCIEEWFFNKQLLKTVFADLCWCSIRNG